MANRTIKEANSIKGTNPQYLVEKIIRNRIYDSRFWKEECFGLTAELLVDKAMALDHIGGTYGQNIQVTPFLCLVLKMLQIQPSKDIIVEFIRRSDYKYVRALGAYYLRLVGTSVDVYKYLEPLYIDYRKMKFKNVQGEYTLTHMDEYIDELLNEARVFGILLPRLQKRWVLEESEVLPPRVSALDDDIVGDGDDPAASDPESDSSSSEESLHKSSSGRHRSLSPDDKHRRRGSSPYRDGSRHSHRHRRHSPHSSRHSHRRRSRSASRSPPPHGRRERREHDTGDRERDRDRREREDKTRDKGKGRGREEVSGKYSREELEEIRQQNELRASLGLNPLKLNVSPLFSRHLLSLRRSTREFSTSFPPSSYLETSSLPTRYFQPFLPQLPIPSLSASCGNYLTAVMPLLDSKQYAHVQNLVEQLESSGRHLQDELVARNKQNKHTSYITGPWTDRYLRDRSSVVLTHNAFMGFRPDPHNMDQLERATKMISLSAQFKASLLDNQLKPMIFHMNPRKSQTESYARTMRMLPGMLKTYTSYFYYKAFPLDMVQFKNLFNSTRIPMPEKDTLVANTGARHVSVVFKGNFYSFDVYREDGTVLSPDEIYQHLLHITESNPAVPSHPVSILTAADRDTWTEARKELVQNEENADSLRSIDEGLFLLCLDSHDSLTVPEVTKSMLHGDGVNRWFDKCFQIIIEPQGHCGLHFEHSWGDGVAVMRLFDALYENSAKQPFQPRKESKAETSVKKMNFNLSDNVKQTIERVSLEFKTRTDKLKMKELQVERGGRKYFKKIALSPDACIQLAIQMAYYLVSDGKTAATYESASTSAFKHGRTETMRPCTNETLDCTKAILSGKLPTEELIQKVLSCSKKHSSLVKQAVMGKGFDRHMFGLASLAKELGSQTPDLFTDPLHQHVNHFVLSTSTLSSDSVLYGAFAPVVDDGFGVGYMVKDESIEAAITSYETRDAKEFADALNLSINKIIDVLERK